MKPKTAVLFSAIVAVLAAMEVKATDDANVPKPKPRPFGLPRPRPFGLPRLQRFGLELRKGRLIKFAVAAGLLVVGYMVVSNYLQYPTDPVYPTVSTESVYPTTEPLPIPVPEHLQLQYPLADQPIPYQLQYLLDYQQLREDLGEEIESEEIQRLQREQLETLLGKHAQQQNTAGSKWAAAGLSSLAMISFFAMALILWSIKQRKKTGRKEAPFSI